MVGNAHPTQRQTVPEWVAGTTELMQPTDPFHDDFGDHAPTSSL